MPRQASVNRQPVPGPTGHVGALDKYTEHLLQARSCSRHRVTGRERTQPPDGGLSIAGEETHMVKRTGNLRCPPAMGTLEKTRQVRRPSRPRVPESTCRPTGKHPRMCGSRETGGKAKGSQAKAPAGVSPISDI